MAGTFRGDDHFKVDAKGRVSIPAPFRRVLEAGDPGWESGKNINLVIVYGDERRKRLECFTIDAISEVDAKILRYPRASKKRLAMQRLYNGQSIATTLDETGRLVLPAKLRKKIGLTNTAYFVGNGDTFEIWHPDTFEAEQYGGLDTDDGFDPEADPATYLDGDIEE